MSAQATRKGGFFVTDN